MKNVKAIRWVLYYTMILNLVVTVLKLVVGYSTGALSLIADGYDSFFDSASNIVGLIGIAIAARPPDPDHPYGHRKFETLSAVAISILLFLTMIELLRSAFDRLRNPTMPDMNVWTIVAPVVSIVLHIYVAWYENKRGKALKSEVLVADAMHTRADVLVSISVLVGIIVIRMGYPVVDAILALFIAVMIGKIGIDIIRDTSQVLTDAAALDVEQIRQFAMSVPGVLFTHNIRSRGQEDDIHLDLHVQVNEGMPIEQAHHIAHQVQRKLLAEFAGVKDVVVHVEPQRGSTDTLAPDLNQRIRAIAGRLASASVHSIQMHDVGGKLYATLHLEVERTLSIERAHELADQLEDMLRTEISEIADVEVHIEPATHPDGPAAAADGATTDQAREALRQAVGEVGGLNNCHDLMVYREDGELMVNVHCECDAALSVDEAHTLSMKLEHRLQERMPSLTRVVVHVEPRQG